MNVLIYLVPLALLLGFLGLAGFMWSLKRGQFDDLEGAGWRALSDDDLPEKDLPEKFLPEKFLPEQNRRIG